MKVLLSIKPEFVERIFSGEKKFEYRRKIFKRNGIERIIIYSTMPEGKIVGEFSISEIHNSSPDLIWNKTKSHSGVNKNFYDSYFKDRSDAYAIEISDVVKYDTPVELKSLGSNIFAPQSFRYLSHEHYSSLS